jgi:hypothetical protein
MIWPVLRFGRRFHHKPVQAALDMEGGIPCRFFKNRGIRIDEPLGFHIQGVDSLRSARIVGSLRAKSFLAWLHVAGEL